MLAFDLLADILAPGSGVSRADSTGLIMDCAMSVSACSEVPPKAAIAHPGAAYVEVRGAKADAQFLARVAQLRAPLPPNAKFKS